MLSTPTTVPSVPIGGGLHIIHFDKTDASAVGIFGAEHFDNFLSCVRSDFCCLADERCECFRGVEPAHGRAFPGPDAAIDTIAQFDAAAAFLFPVMQIDG